MPKKGKKKGGGIAVGKAANQPGASQQELLALLQLLPFLRSGALQGLVSPEVAAPQSVSQPIGQQEDKVKNQPKATNQIETCWKEVSHAGTVAGIMHMRHVSGMGICIHPILTFWVCSCDTQEVGHLARGAAS